MISYICSTGFICGYVKKFGIRARYDMAYPINEIDPEKLTYFAFHDGLSGNDIMINHT